MSRQPTIGVTGRTARIGLHARRTHGIYRVAVHRHLAAIIDGLGCMPGIAPSSVIDCHHYSRPGGPAGIALRVRPVAGALL